jgi:hypothetical protein
MRSDGKFISKLMLTAIISLANFYSKAEAGGSDRGGGEALLCYDNSQTRELVYQALLANEESLLKSNNSIYVDLKLQELAKPVELLDIFEAGIQRGIAQPAESSTSQASASGYNFYQRLQNFAPQFWSKFNSSIIPDKNWTGFESGIVRLIDSNRVVDPPPNCLIVQTARYDNGQIRYDARIVTKMSEVSKRALRMHEDLYHFHRKEAAWRKAILKEVLGGTNSETVMAIFESQGFGEIDITPEIFSSATQGITS